MSNTSEFIKNFIDNKIATHTTEKNYFNEQILVLDNSREDYKKAIYKIDSNVFESIQDVNNKIKDVQNAYQNRINVGCRTDLFWRYTGPPGILGIFGGTYVCDRISPIGFGTESLTYISSDDIESGISTTPDNLIGLEPHNLYGIRICDEPYSGDVIDSYVGSFIGTIGIGSTILTLMSPKLTTQVSQLLTIGQIVIDDNSDVFSIAQTNEIVGLATTSVSLVSLGYPDTPTLVDQIILKYPAIRTVNAPDFNGSFASFTVLKDPDQIQDYGLPFASNPYTPQTIKMMDSTTLGTGTQIEFDNASGYPNSSQSWNKFMDGFVDPTYAQDEIEVTVTKPQVGAGKIYYTIGFEYEPMLNGVPAKFGDTGTSTIFSSECTVRPLPSCSAEIEDAVDAAIEIRDVAETNLTNSNSEILAKIQLSNTIREELSEIDIRIWSYRCHMGKASENLDLYGTRMNELNSNAFKDLID